MIRPAPRPRRRRAAVAAAIGGAAAVLGAVAAPGCAKQVQDPIGPVIDFGDPKSVVGGVFHAARAGDPAPLAALCDPASEPSVARLCRIGPGDPDWASFRAAFARARLNGEPRVHGDRAALNFVFGPDGTTSETMELSRDARGRWHLLRF